MKLFQKWKKIALSVSAVCVLAFSALAVGLIAPASNDGVIAAGETPNNVTIDFSESTDINNFSVTNSGGTVGTITDGRYYPNAWGRNYCTIALPTDQTRMVSFDFYAPSLEDNGDTYSQMWVSLITDVADIETAGKNLGLRFYTGAGNWLTSSAQKSDGHYLSETADKLSFGEEHRMDIYISNGKVSFAIDDAEMVFLNGYGTSFDVPSNGTDSNAYLYFEFSHAGGWIDNVTISDGTLLDFSGDYVAQKNITTISGSSKGVAENGVYNPVAWAQNYWVKPIDTTTDVVVSYDFYMPSYETLGTADNYSQFYASLVSDLTDINGTDESGNAKSITFRLYDDGSVTPRSTSHSVWPAAQRATAESALAWSEDVSYFDNSHHMDIQIVDGVITYYVDNTALFSGTTFDVPADTVYFFFEMSHAGGYIDNLQVAEYVAPPFEEVSLDFSDSAHADYFLLTSSGTKGSITDGKYYFGNWGRHYLNIPFPTSEFKCITYDFYVPSRDSSYNQFYMSIITDPTDINNSTKSIAFRMYTEVNGTQIYKAAQTATNHIGTSSQTFFGALHHMAIIIENGYINYYVDGMAVTLSNGASIPVPSYSDQAYLFFEAGSASGTYIDNLRIENDLDSFYEIQRKCLFEKYNVTDSDKSFVGYDEKITPNTKDSGTAWGAAYTALSDGATVRRSTYYNMKYDWSGAEYYAFDVVNNTDGYVAFGLDLKEGYYAKNGAISAFGTGSITYGRWWTAAEYMPYYLVYADGTVQSGQMLRNTLNRGKAFIPEGFEGTVIFPISSFEILDWSANTAQYDWFTDDANVLALDHILFADVIYCNVAATAGSVTTSNERLLSSDFGAAASVARTIRAIDQIGTVSAASERLIAFARENYDALSAEDQANVTNYAALTAAETAFYNLTDYSYSIGTDGKDFEGESGVAFGSVFDSAPSTVSAWIKVDRDTPDDEHVGTVMGNAERKMSSSVLYDYWNTFSFEITTNGNPKFEWRVSRTSKVVFIVENADVRTGSWMHVAFTRDVDNGLITCYINGTAVATMNVAASKIANFSFVKPVMIGNDYTDNHILALSFTPDFHGSIADVRVYSTLLTAEEVESDMLGERASGLLGGVDFSSGEEGEYYDYVNEDATDAFGWKSVESDYFAAEDGEFTFAIIPDTQMIFSRAPADSNGVGIFNGTYTAAAEGEVAGTWESAYNVEDNLGFRNMQWLIDNQELLNLQYVMHVGDLTDNLNYYTASNVNSSYKKWQIEGMIEADYGFQMLNKLTEAGIPWSLSRGNHDGGYDKNALAVWDKYWTQSNAYTKAKTNDLLDGEPAKYCVTTRDGVDHIYSYYEKLEINGIKYLILVLDLEAGDTVLAWANEVAAYFTDYRIIVSTHAYLGSRAALMTSLMGSADLNNAGQTVWDEFVSQHSNIQMMICGHSSGEDIVRKEMTGVNGNKVWTFMIDSSAHEFTGVTQPGLMALIKFSADGKTLTLNHYSMVQGELFGSFNSFTVTLGDLEETESGGEDTEVEVVWPNKNDTREIVVKPNFQPFTYTSSQLKCSSLGLYMNASSQLQFKGYYAIYGVTVDITKTGVWKFLSSAQITVSTSTGVVYLTMLHTSAKDGLTRVIPLTDPDDTDTYTVDANNLYSFNDVVLGNILPEGVNVEVGDQITIVFAGNTAWCSKCDFSCAVYDNTSTALETFTWSVNATVLQGLSDAGYNGVKGDGTAAATKNYNGFTMGWLKPYGTFETFYTFRVNTITVTDEEGNTLFTAVSPGMQSTPNVLPVLHKEGYIHTGYKIGDTLYPADACTPNNATATTGNRTQTVIAVFEKIPDAIMDAEGNAVIDTSAGFNGALPELSRTGHIFIGYMIDGKLYPAGTVYDKASGATVVAVFAEFSMVNGASIRLGTPTGMRFQTYLDTTAYGYLEGNVTFGTLIAKADDITTDGVLNYSLLTTDAAMTKLNIASTSQHTVGNYLYFNGVLAEIKENHYDWKFAARGYMTVTYADGTTAVFYANVTDNARSVQEVAEKAMADVSKVQSKDYATAVEGGFSAYTDDERTVIEVFIKKEDLV